MKSEEVGNEEEWEMMIKSEESEEWGKVSIEVEYLDGVNLGMR